MVEREELLAYVKEKFNTNPDYSWLKYPEHAVLRHEVNGKWYGVIMNIPRIKLGLSGKGNAEILNLKCDPALNSLLKSKDGIFPEYHMNKKHWITIALDSLFSKEEIYNLISLSYDLTK
ncbi:MULTISPECIES: MmcQ/YjbR family DNA-binding protein [Clostridium]|uniref:MmcQ/YjbR family DNA-binding protein n=1 Tax=Clostridium TaxID=1485 RepID=UPI0003D31399|nr:MULTISPECIES: MmcQ/YjbR family DNA-binding protein [Clostridium]ALB45366.1 MmcQ/YjbR family DNA-binding protein [Clostridium beijerinckii NRRL B-598]OVE70269.1 MmcQ family protein [Clostridium diolis]